MARRSPNREEQSMASRERVRRMKRGAAGALVAGAGLAAAAMAAPPGAGMDQEVLALVHRGHQTRVAFAQLASAKGDDRSVRNYGTRVTGETNSADDRLLEYGRRRGLAARNTAAADTPALDTLQNDLVELERFLLLEGPDFDRE